MTPEQVMLWMAEDANTTPETRAKALASVKKYGLKKQPSSPAQSQLQRPRPSKEEMMRRLKNYWQGVKERKLEKEKQKESIQMKTVFPESGDSKAFFRPANMKPLELQAWLQAHPEDMLPDDQALLQSIQPDIPPALQNQQLETSDKWPKDRRDYLIHPKYRHPRTGAPLKEPYKPSTESVVVTYKGKPMELPQELQEQPESQSQQPKQPQQIVQEKGIPATKGISQKAKIIGSILLGIGIIVGVILIATFSIKGGLWIFPNSTEVNIDGNIRKIATLKSDQTYFKSREDIQLLRRIFRSLLQDFRESNLQQIMTISKAIKQQDFEGWERLMGEFIKANCKGIYTVKKL
jgi:hypothetical protein